MSNYLGRSLKFFNSVRSYNRNFCGLIHPSHCSFDGRNHQETRLTRKLYEAQPQLCRNFSFESINNLYHNLYSGITTSAPSEAIKSFLIEFHDLTGLPWWSTVVLAGVAMKITIGLPLAIYQQYLVARLHLTKGELQKAMKELEPEMLLRAKKEKWNDKKLGMKKAIEAKKMWKKLTVKNNCHPFKVVILSWCNFPIWLFFMFTLRDLLNPSNLTVPLLTQFALQTEGVFWQTNLMLPDASWILPVLCTLSSLTLLEINSLSNVNAMSFHFRFVTVYFRCLSILFFFIELFMPAGLVLFWLTSFLFGLSQNLLLLSPKVRRFCRIPMIPTEVQKPYSHIWKKFLEKYSKPIKFFRRSKVLGD